MESSRNLESRQGGFGGGFPNSGGFNSGGFNSASWSSGGFGGGFGGAFGTHTTVPKGRKGGNSYRKSVNNKYGCIFPVTRLRRKMKQMTHKRVGEKTAAFLAKMMDVFVHELVRQAGNVIKKQNRKRLTPRSIFLPFDTDVDFERLAKQALLPFSGTHEHIHKVLLKKAKGRFVKSPRKGRRKTRRGVKATSRGVKATSRGVKATPAKKRAIRMKRAPAKIVRSDSSTSISPSITPSTTLSITPSAQISVTPSVTPSISPSTPFSITASSKKPKDGQKRVWTFSNSRGKAAGATIAFEKKGGPKKRKVDLADKDKAKVMAKAPKTGRATRLDKPRLGSDWWSTTPSITPSISPAGGTPTPNRSISVTPSVSPGGTQTITAKATATGNNFFIPSATATTSISPGGTRSINASASAPPINPLSKI